MSSDQWPTYGERNAKYDEAYNLLKAYPVPKDYKELRMVYDGIKASKPESPTPADMVEYDIEIPMRDGTANLARVIKPKDLAPAGAPLAVIIHGGGYMTGDRWDEVWTCRILAKHTGAVALSIQYRRAPEHVFPTANLDCWDAVKWAAENASDLGANPKLGFLVGGNSAGGNLAIICGILSVQEALNPPITGLALQVPLVSGDKGTPEKWRHEITSYERGEDAPVMDTGGVRCIFDTYKPDFNSPLFSPYAPGLDLKKFPPVFFQVAGLDPLKDEALIFERHLREDQGVPTRLNVYTALPHAFWFLDLPPLESDSAQAREDYIAGVKWLISSVRP